LTKHEKYVIISLIYCWKATFTTKEIKMSEQNFNHSHPELKTGEIWLTNENDFLKFDLSPSVYSTLPFPSKRKGKVAYDMEGNIQDFSYPIFVQKSEWEAVHGPYNK